ncbi:UDP-N-acetylglucosamine:LPS N-acetylglucosamine transferase [Clostridium aceticum]|uniref:UDP-N-acetylglucosamine:LPS N-acetylglucosamine transferase n=1 Tax=Clostridium aceticum TaxID=84022 RepID=A0A0G3W9E6_9CLOT|nr:glycosyltransferase [Clostridium aceticum]AKL94064.1 UDP-N-acetylglucosamine:LPS N-acetylglucosamine transferase [Clostridium aceticum]
MRLAIVTASVGQGHNSVALALQEAFQLEDPNIKIKIFDVLDDSRVYQFFTNVYLQVITKNPSIYSKIFYWSQQHQQASSIISYLNFVCFKTLKKMKQSFQPDAFIFTHPIPTNSYNATIKIPAWTIITDYSYHPIWYNSDITGYFVANDHLQNQLLKNKYPIESIFNTGLPIKQSFTTGKKVYKPLIQYPDTHPLILIMGGGLGIGALNSIVEKLETIDFPFQGLIVTGKNERLYWEMKKLENRDSKKWEIISFTNEIPSLMKKASLLITKAGAITLTEAQACELPTIIYNPIPGHEEENAHCVCQQGWATWAKNS